MPKTVLDGEKLWTMAVVCTAIVLRAGAWAAFPENLTDDRDNYLSLAQQVAGGHGYSNATTGKPTAFRPPLYPLILSGLLRLSGTVAMGIAHLCAAALTVWLTIHLGRRLGLGAPSLLAGAIVAVDPLLVQYTTFPMTETLCALLAMLLGWSIATTHEGLPERPRRAGGQLLVGLVFGLCVLCRPTFWAFGVLIALVWFMGNVRSGSLRQIVQDFPLWLFVGLIAAVSPWVIRNLIVLGRPIVTTTHGGYTLLLGNNPVYYQQEVDKPRGTVWEDAPPEQSQEAWYAQVLAEMHAEIGEDVGETATDRWMSQRAERHIRDEPVMFLKACLHRFARFWSISPQRPALDALPSVVGWMIGLFYALLITGFVLGLGRVVRQRNWTIWMPAVLLVASFSLVHLVYWSNIRMRAPVVPLIALLSAYGWGIFTRNRQGHLGGRKTG